MKITKQAVAERIAAYLHHRITLAHAFGLAWDDCEELLKQLGFSARIDIVAS